NRKCLSCFVWYEDDCGSRAQAAHLKKEHSMRHLPGFSVAAPALVVLALVTQAGFGQSQSMQQMTPLLLALHDAPIPFTGSDERLHLVYELWMTNFSSADVAVEKVEVLGDGSVLQTLDTASVASRLQPAGQRESTGTLP